MKRRDPISRAKGVNIPGNPYGNFRGVDTDEFGRIFVRFPVHLMSPEEAVNMAAWLLHVSTSPENRQEIIKNYLDRITDMLYPVLVDG